MTCHNRYASNNTDAIWISDLKREIQSGQKSRVLIPTGSSQGDRYYVKAKWNPEDKSVVECLTRLFHQTLIHDRTFEEEIEKMKDRDERWVYWYSKEWALWITQQIEDCGGKAFFMGV